MSLTVLNNPRIIAATTQLASLSREYSFLKNITEVADTAGGYQSIPLPSMDWVMDQYVSIDPINMQVDDQLSSITISLKRMVAPTALVIT